MNENQPNTPAHLASVIGDMKPLGQSTWATKEEIAQHFQIGVRTVTSLMARRLLPYTKVQHIVRFNVRECDRAFRFFQRGRTMAALSRSKAWVTKSQLATHLKVSPRTITNLMRNQTMPYVKIGRLVRFDLNACDEQMRLWRTAAATERRIETQETS